MKQLILSILAAAVSVSAFAVAPTDFKKKVPITVNAEAVGDKTATDIPVLVKISTAIDGFSYSDMAADGSDLAFGVEDGGVLTVYPHEIDTWNPSGESLVWVKVPSLSSSTSFAMYYGNGASSGVAASSTWSGYTGVWHLNDLDADASTYGSYANSSSLGSSADGEKAQVSIADESGRFGKSVRISDGGCQTGNYNFGGVFIPHSSALGIGNTFTISGWFKHADQNYYYDHYFYKRERCDNSPTKSTSGEVGAFAIEQDASKTIANKFSICGCSSSKYAPIPSTSTYNFKNWNYFSFVFNGTSATLYVNGNKFNSGNIAAVTDNTSRLVFGNNINGYGSGKGDAAYCGWIDEVRLAGGRVYSDDYAALEYAAMGDGMLAYGSAITLDATMPKLESMSATVAAGSVTISANFSGNLPAANSVFAVIGGNEYAMSTSDASVPATYSVTINSLAADTTCDYAIKFSSTGGSTSTKSAPAPFYTGVISVVKVNDADESSLASGYFRVSRVDTGSAIALNYSIGGTADADVDYQALSGSVVIPAGEASVQIEVEPIYNAAKQEDVTVEVTLSASSAYLLDDATKTASLKIVNSSSNPYARYVATNGSDDNDGMTAGSAKLTVSAAIADLVASYPDEPTTVWVLDGDYVFSAKQIIANPVTVRSVSGNPASVTFTENQSVGCNIFTLNHVGAKLLDITVSGGGGGNYSNGVSGGNVYIDTNGGTVEHCVIKDGICNAKHSSCGGNIYMAAGTVTRCVISGGKAHNAGGGGNIFIKNGFVDQCLIYGGTDGGSNGGGVHINDGVIANCTIYGNSGVSATGVCIGQNASKKYSARVVNCVIVDNTYTSFGWDYANVCGPVAAAAYFENCMTDGLAQPNNSCFGQPFGFLNQPAANYRLTAISSARNAGVPVVGLNAVDLDGKLRQSGSAVDVGCYEFDESIASVGFDAVGTENRAPFDVTFSVVSAGVEDPVYVWNFGDGSDPVESAEAQVVHTYTQCGNFTVSVSIKGTSVSASVENFVASHPTVMYVDQSCATPVYPYTTPETAATTIQAALGEAYEGSTILLKDDTYIVSEQIKIKCGVTIRSLSGTNSAVTVKGNGTRGVRVFYLNHPHAWLRDITIAEGYTYQSNGGNVIIDSMGGNVSNCVLRAGYATNNSSKGANLAMLSDSAFVTHCSIIDGKEEDNGIAIGAANAYIEKGTIEHSLIAGGIDNSNGSRAQTVAGVYASGGVIRNCTIAANSGKKNGGVYAEGTAQVIECVIAGNTTSVDTGDVAAWNGLDSCYTNCISDTTAAINETCLIDTTAKILKNLDAGDYTHAAASKAIDRCASAEGAPAVDLKGDDRVQGDAMDLGCYEAEADAFAFGFDSDIKSGILDAENGISVVFTATPAGCGDEDEIRYSWDYDGDGTVDETSLIPVVTNVYRQGGTYTVIVGAENLTTGKIAESVTKPDMLQFAPKTLYVWTASETPSVPYDSWEKASTSLKSAIAAAVDGCEIVIRAGTINEGTISVEKDLEVRSESGIPEDVRISGNGYTRPVYLNSVGLFLHGVTVENGFGNTIAAGLVFGVNGGTVSNCVVRNCYSYNFTGNGAAINNAESESVLVTHCVLTNNTLGSDNGGSIKGIVYLIKGRLENSLFMDNRSATDGPCTCLLQLGSKSAVANCTFVGNSTPNRQCVDVSSGAVLTNCVFAGNVYSTAEGRGFLVGDASAFVNCATDLETPINETCIVGTKESFFKDYAGGNFVPKTGGPLINKGVTPAGWVEITDLAGKPRVNGRSIDIGCYEGRGAGMTLFIR